MTGSSPLIDWASTEHDTIRAKADRANVRELGHWGSANSTNTVAWTTSLYGDGGRFRPRDAKMELREITHEYGKPSDHQDAKERYVYAQDQVDKFPRSEHPTLWRGMGIPQALARSLEVGETLPMTGCTAFSFYEHVADRYSDSQWTRSHSDADMVALKIELERTQEFDDTIAGWHHAHSSSDDPAFEVVSGINAVKVVSIERTNTRIAVEARGGRHVPGRSRPDMSDQFDPERIVIGRHDDEHATRLPMAAYIRPPGSPLGVTPVLVRVPPEDPDYNRGELRHMPDEALPGLDVGGLWTIEGAPFAGMEIGEVVEGRDIEPLLHEHYANSIRVKVRGVLE